MAGKVACLYCEQEYYKTRQWQKFCSSLGLGHFKDNMNSLFNAINYLGEK